MADLVVVGSVALDSVQTPLGKVAEVLGGSATYFAYAASFFTQVRVVAAVGEDFPRAHLDLLRERRVDIEALEVRRQMENPILTALDTMNFWIGGKRDALLRVLREVDVLIINDAEVRMLAREPNLIKAARVIVAMGPRVVVIKRGEYGAVMVSGSEFFFTPAYPLESVFDPTGAGDTFAGGFMGCLAQRGLTDPRSVRRAMVFGAVMASFTVEDFSLERLKRLTSGEIEERYDAFQSMVSFER